MDAKIDFIKELSVLDLKEDDILILKSNSCISDSQYQLLMSQVKRALPDRLKGKVKAIVTENIDIGILRTKLNESD